MMINAGGYAYARIITTQYKPIFYFNIKRTIVSGDTAKVQLICYKNGSPSLPVGWVFNAATLDPAFGLSFIGPNSDPCDSIEIRFIAGKLTGSSLLVDDVYFGYPAGISQADRHSHSLFPNR